MNMEEEWIKVYKYGQNAPTELAVELDEKDFWQYEWHFWNRLVEQWDGSNMDRCGYSLMARSRFLLDLIYFKLSSFSTLQFNLYPFKHDF